MSRVGLGRHGQIDDDAGDPLDGLVNLFDLGIVLAIGFLVAGLSIAGKSHATTQTSSRSTHTQTITTPSRPAQRTGTGRAVGQVFELPDGQLVLVKKK